MLKTFITLIAAVATLAAAAIAPVDYIEALRANPIGMVLYTFVMYSSAIYISYVLFNIFSGLLGQGDAGRAPTLYWIDYVPSWLALISFTCVGVWVALGCRGVVQGFTPITHLADVPNSYWVLLVLVIFSWIDVGVLQGHKHAAALQYIQTQRSIAPAPAVAPAAPAVPAAAPAPAPAPTPVAAPAHVGSGVFLAIGFVIVVILLAICFSGGDGRRAEYNPLSTYSVWLPAVVVGRVIVQTTEHPFADVPKTQQYRCAPDSSGVLVAATPGTGWCHD